MRRASLLLSLLLLAACGGASPDSSSASATPGDSGGEDDFPDFDDGFGEAPGSHATASAVELIGINPPAQPWRRMSHEEREWDMVGRFHPVMRELFQNYDAERWADFECVTCHGEDADERNYEMPSPQMMPLPPPNTRAYQAAARTQPELTAYMEETVVPAMQTMLGFRGAQCAICHPVVPNAR